MTEKRLTAGRPPKAVGTLKKPRAVSLTDDEHAELLRQAADAGYPNQPSAYLIKKLRLSVTPKSKQL